MIEVLRHPTDEDWKLAKLCAITTRGMRKVINEPDEQWKHEMLRARHTPCRTLQFAIRFDTIPSFVATHLARHVHAVPFVQSMRDDLGAEQTANRNTPVLMILYMNAEELMTIANRRLCNKAHPETRAVVKEMCDEITKLNPEFSPFLVPFCKEYGCHEITPCYGGLLNMVIKKAIEEINNNNVHIRKEEENEQEQGRRIQAGCQERHEEGQV